MDSRSTAQSVWRAARHGLTRLNQLLAERDLADDAVFRAPPRDADRTVEAERRIAEARKARLRN